jgi:hypothetical protein
MESAIKLSPTDLSRLSKTTVCSYGSLLWVSVLCTFLSYGITVLGSIQGNH